MDTVIGDAARAKVQSSGTERIESPVPAPAPPQTRAPQRCLRVSSATPNPQQLSLESHILKCFVKRTKCVADSAGGPCRACLNAQMHCNYSWDLNHPVVKREKELRREKELQRSSSRSRRARSSSAAPRPLARAQSLGPDPPASNRTMKSGVMALGASTEQGRRPFTRARSMSLQPTRRSYHNAPGASLGRRAGEQISDQLAL